MVAAIFVILSTIVLSSNARFGNRIVLQNLAHDIALAVRQAQVYSISVQRYSDDVFDSPYGMYFSSASPQNYYLFVDLSSPRNGLYDGGETVRATTIQGGYAITALCTIPLGSEIETCGRTRLDITYVRPESDAYIRAEGQSTLYQRARIEVTANSGDTASIYVDATGQIYVK